MANNSPKKKPRGKYFTATEANAMLPLVRAIVTDIMALARDLRDRHARLSRLEVRGIQRGLISADQLEEEQAAFERDHDRLVEFEEELAALGVELKDHLTGLLDFRAKRAGREVYLCWKMGEEKVAHWHELDAGFAGRQPLIGDDFGCDLEHLPPPRPIQHS
jgi:hypothetical protein